MTLHLYALILDVERHAQRLNGERNRLLAEAKATRTRRPRPQNVWARRWCGRRLMVLGFKVAGHAAAPAS